MSRAFDRQAVVACSTLRPPAVGTGGVRGVPVAALSGLRCTPLDPADPGGRGEAQQRLILESQGQILETFVRGSVDIRAGDVLAVGARRYAIRAVAQWRWRHEAYRGLLVEEMGGVE